MEVIEIASRVSRLVAIVVGWIAGRAVVFGAGGRGSIPLVAVSAALTLAAVTVS